MGGVWFVGGVRLMGGAGFRCGVRLMTRSGLVGGVILRGGVIPYHSLGWG